MIMDADSTHKTPHCVRKKTPPTRNHQVNVHVSDAAWQALQQLNIHFGTALNDTIETLAMDAELRILLEKGREDDLETG